jgi:hypothetical protein
LYERYVIIGYTSVFILLSYNKQCGNRGSTVVKVLCYK